LIPAKSFTDILAQRGRIVIFTRNAVIGLRFEQHAERHHAKVVCTRGWADPIGPLGEWNRMHNQRDYGVLSCDQQRYVTGMRLPATDLVWVGPFGDPLNVPHLWGAMNQAMHRANHLELLGTQVNKWVLAEDAL
jgi:hypothetical protein